MEILQPPDQDVGVGCMSMMDNFGYMDLIENNDFLDPSSIFQADENFLEEFNTEQNLQQELQVQQRNEELAMETKSEVTQKQESGEGASDDLAMVFLEWLKSNKETVSAEDLRKVKIKKATIECAAKRLGGGKAAMKQLLKLILEWVQTNHLQKRRMKESSQDPLQNPNPNLNCSNSIQPDQSNPCFSQSPWIAPPPYISDPAATGMQGFQPMVGYMADPFVNGASNMAGQSYPPPQPPQPPSSSDYQMLDSAQSWSASQFALASHYSPFPDNNLQPVPTHPNVFSGYGNQYPCQYLPTQVGDTLVRLGSSATKEARKKRMARQRRFMSHHRNHNHQNNNQQNQNQNQNTVIDHHGRLGSDNITPAAQPPNPGNWVYWPAAVGGVAVSTTPVLPMDAPPVHTVDRPAMQSHQNHQRQVASDRRQGWKPEKNLRFLLQKVLKQSDVGNLGRIVLPKKEAETHLPELEARDGISIAMEDIGTSRVWNMRYRFWPNNKSRMYLLENTGDFVRTNGLQEGDFIVIYSDVKCGKYLIRGVKVRQPGAKPENKKARKSPKNSHASTPATVNGSSSNTNQTQTVK
ncbi:hypothetical protein JCGZ_17582 [Jatropha curcas]|uniref:TF-B3 domain-containing protein n=2 Tax=Jatropha curcas TaxID=180498 RepID=A0A067K3N4_JATCU|nr:hypothetical protein JCGZ_17582 [Jatropha curcas]